MKHAQSFVQTKDELEFILPGWAMLNAWPKITMCRISRDGNPCLKDQMEDLKDVGKMTFWKI